MSDAIVLALIVAVPAMFSPLLMAWITNRNRRAEKREDYARQDAVAEKAAEVAETLLMRQAEVAAATAEQARLLKENNRVVSEQAAATLSQFQVLTGMMDGNFTKLMESELDAIAHGLVLSRQVIALTFAAGHEPAPESLAEIKATEAKIDELRKTIAERRRTADAMHATSTLGRIAVAAETIADATEKKT